MQNFHFNPINNRSVHLIKQLEQIDRQLEGKKKLLEKKKLEEEFYQDKRLSNPANYNFPPSNYYFSENNQQHTRKQKDNNLNIADLIMNQLLSDNKSKQIQQQASPRKNYSQPITRQEDPRMYQNFNNFNPPSSNQPKQYQMLYEAPINQTKNNANHPYQNGNNNQNLYQRNQQKINLRIPSFPPRQNNFIQPNKRDIQKQRLQNGSGNDQNPFISRTIPVKRSVDQKQQKPIVNQRQLQKIKLQQQSSRQQNPFWGQNQIKNRSLQRENNPIPLKYVAEQFQNIGQRQKQKLQQKLHNNNDFDIYQRPMSPPQIPAERQNGQQQNVSKKAAFDNRYSNPFLKDEQFLRQKKDEQLREYRRALQQQKKTEQQRKKQQKLMFKQQKYAFNAYQPGAAGLNNGSTQNNNQKQLPIKSPTMNMTKKIDPNGKPPVFNYDQNANKYKSSSDIEYMKMKASELRDNYKKGRILHDQYIQQVKKLAQFYKVNFKDLIDKKDLDQQSEELPWLKESIKKQDQKRASMPLKSLQKPQQKQNNINSKYEIIENEQSMEKFPDSETSLRRNNEQSQPQSPSRNKGSYQNSSNHLSQNHSYNNQYGSNPHPNIYTQNMSSNLTPHQYGMASTALMQQFPQMDYDLMRRMFEQLKSMRSDYTKSLENEKVFLQETFMKFVNNNIVHQQLSQPSIQNNSKNLNSSNNHKGKISPKTKERQPNNNIFSQASQQNMTDQSVDYVQKSLSGIVNKIPFYTNSVKKNNAYDPSFIGGSYQQQNFNSYKKPTQIKEGNMQQGYMKGNTVQQFFSKPYKTKKFKKFSIMVDVSQSSMQIPNVSNFLALKNGKDVVNHLFEEDLIMIKKLQRQKDVQKLRNRVDNQLGYGTYGETFNGNKINMQGSTTDKKNIYTNFGNQNSIEKNQLITQVSKYEQYQNHSRGKSIAQNERDNKIFDRKNYRSYKKTQEQEQLPSNGFLKRHISNNEENPPNFADQSDIKVRSPLYYSPKLNSEILQQDEYQTAEKINNQEILESQFYGSSVRRKVTSPQNIQSVTKKYQMKKKDFAYEEQRESQKKHSRQKSPQFDNKILKQKDRQRSQSKNQKEKIMNIMQQHNQALKKYATSPKNLNNYEPYEPYDQQMDIKQYSSINTNHPRQYELINYFVGNGEGGSIDNAQNYMKPPIIMNGSSKTSNNDSGGHKSKHLSNKFNSQKYNQFQQHNQIYEESLQTLKSQQQSFVKIKEKQLRKSRSKSPKVNNLYQKSRNQQESYENTVSMQYSVAQSHKNEGSINHSQTVESYDQSSSRLVRPPLNKKKSTSRKKQSSIVRTKFQKDSILQKPPHSQSQMNSMMNNSEDDIATGSKPLKFDSNVYDSQYEQSVDQSELQKRINNLQREQNISKSTKIMQPYIYLGVPLIIKPISNPNKLEQNQSSQASTVVNGGKLKSLQQARNLAKECKKKSISSTQNQNILRYEQKMSELESFLTKRDDSIIRQNRQTRMIKLAIKESPKKKSLKKDRQNIMNLLDELQNQSSYREDFESYREESEREKR